MALTNTTSLSFEQKVFQLTNQERAKKGLKPLKANAELNYVADTYAQEMAERGVLSHTGPDGSQAWDRAKEVGYEAFMMAENIAAGQRTPEQVVQGWMNSSGHRANMLNPNYTEIGVGYHNKYWVQNFGSGDTNPISKIQNTPSSAVASNLRLAPESDSQPVPVSVLSAAQPLPQSTYETDEPIGDIIANQDRDWQLEVGMGNNTPKDARQLDTFAIAQGGNTELIQLSQLDTDKELIGATTSLEALPLFPTDKPGLMGDWKTQIWFVQVDRANLPLA
ncbi:hypothetical protein NUACC21_31330 [Scytonema sp. NUACC21]